MPLAITIRDIAKKAGVSVTTVSRVLNNKPDVSKKTREKVLQVIADMGYSPNAMARGLIWRKTLTIGLVIPDIGNPFFAEVAKGVEHRARERGYSVIFCTTDSEPQREQEAIELLCSKQVDGIIVSLSVESRSVLERLEKQRFPVVQIDRKVPGSNYSAIAVDNVASAYTATKYLIRQGHSRIAHITGDMNTKTAQDRLLGYKEALSDWGLRLEHQLIVHGDFSKGSGILCMEELLSRTPLPSAVFVGNDLMALGAMEAIGKHGLRVPDDVALVGYDNIDLAASLQLTTIMQPKFEMGQLAATTLITSIEKGEPAVGDIILDTMLIERKSSAATVL
ncbi:MAG: LacI family transcriptional regulator [Firmicutes bacterium]|nr:LacI family transcriptional regulator [Bacillota bacterium]NLY30088.1 LacI family transcriptional regulator [Bacillota bacterium]